MDIADVSRVPVDVLRNVEADTYWCMSRLLDGIQVSRAAGVPSSVGKMHRPPPGLTAPRTGPQGEAESVLHREGLGGGSRDDSLGLGRVWMLQGVPQVQRVRQPLQMVPAGRAGTACHRRQRWRREPVERFMLQRPAPWRLGPSDTSWDAGAWTSPGLISSSAGRRGVQGLLWCWGRCLQVAPGP